MKHHMRTTAEDLMSKDVVGGEEVCYKFEVCVNMAS